MKRIIILLFLLLIILPLNVSADRGIKIKLRTSEQKGAPVEKEVQLYSASYALVIGIDKYTGGWPSLSGAVNDADLIAKALKKKGFDVTLKKNLKSAELKNRV